MESDSEQPDKKKRRVTKACDQCRKRRIKCASYPNTAIDAPCVICTEASQAENCTYSRPTRKRGPQAGKAKNLQEKCEAFERLLGHLILTIPSLSTSLDVFFRTASSDDSPFDTNSPSSTSSGSMLTTATTAEQQQVAYRSSTIAKQIETVLPATNTSSTSNPTTSIATRDANKSAMSDKREEPSPALSSTASQPAPSPNSNLGPSWDPNSLPSRSAVPPQAQGFANNNSFPSSLRGGGPSFPSSYPQYNHSTASTSATNPNPFDGFGNLQALAHAAVPDSEHSAMEGVISSSSTVPNQIHPSPSSSRYPSFGVPPPPPTTTTTKTVSPSPQPPYRPLTTSRDKLEIPLLPSENIRNQLLDLYFNQVVQPFFPMLDKTLFLRWSAHLPNVPTQTTTSLPASRLIPPCLYLAVFALSSSYLSPTSASSTHRPQVWADAARNHLWNEIEKGPNLEAVQSAIIGAIVDWGSGELNRAWVISSIAVALSINLSLHLVARTQPDPNSLKLKTFHSALIVHILLSLRLSRVPLVTLEDYDVSIPPVDGNEDFELWRSDKTPNELKEEWSHSRDGEEGGGNMIDSPNPNLNGGSSFDNGNPSKRTPQAVRSASLSTFARMASLCAIGLSILRWDVCPRRGYGQSLSGGEQRRVELVESLKTWSDELENELRLGEKGGGVERLEERARWTVEMHLTFAALNLRLRPHPSFAATIHDPVPSSLVLLHHVLNRHRNLFTMYRSLPTVDFALHTLSSTLFQQSDYAPHQHDAPMRAYEEMSRLFPVAKTSVDALRAKVDGHKRELGLIRGVHPTASTVPPPAASTPATVALSEPFQAFLSYSNDLGPAANPETVLDFGMWEQTDLLFSLGLVMDPNGSMNGWGLPQSGGGGEGTTASEALPLPPMIEADFSALDGGGNASTSNQPGQSNQAHILNYAQPHPPRSQPLPTNATPQFDSSLFAPAQPQVSLPVAQPQPPTHHFNPHSSLHPPSYPSASYFFDPTPIASTLVGNTVGGPAIGGTGQTGERSTDLLTRWLDRGSLAMEGFGDSEGQS